MISGRLLSLWKLIVQAIELIENAQSKEPKQETMSEVESV